MIKSIVFVAFSTLVMTTQALANDLPLTAGLSQALANQFNVKMMVCKQQENDALQKADAQEMAERKIRANMSNQIAQLRKKPSIPLPHELITGAVNDAKADKIQKDLDARGPIDAWVKLTAAITQVIPSMTASCRRTAAVAMGLGNSTDAQLTQHLAALEAIRQTSNTTSRCTKRDASGKPTCMCQEAFPARSGYCYVPK